MKKLKYLFLFWGVTWYIYTELKRFKILKYLKKRNDFLSERLKKSMFMDNIEILNIRKEIKDINKKIYTLNFKKWKNKKDLKKWI